MKRLALAALTLCIFLPSPGGAFGANAGTKAGANIRTDSGADAGAADRILDACASAAGLGQSAERLFCIRFSAMADGLVRPALPLSTCEACIAGCSTGSMSECAMACAMACGLADLSFADRAASARGLARLGRPE